MLDRSSLSRRTFIKNSALFGASLATLGMPASGRAATGANEKFVVAIVGLRRGMALANGALALPNVEIAWVCDVDSERLAQGAARVKERQGKAPKTTQDLREVFDDSDVDAVFLATTNHWHAPAAILACAAGKHVYVEKPGSHNPWEAEAIVAAARKYKRVVQVGNQRRSWPGIIEGIERVRGGIIGEVYFARTYYSNRRDSIGKGKPVPVPAHLDYSLWQGPAPERPYKDNLVHYNWHWHTHWGNGELGNNGIHTLDLARWGLDVDYPTRVSYRGKRYHFDDDWEFPDTAVAMFDFEESKGISWECSSSHPRRGETRGLARFYGSDGTLVLTGSGYEILDLDGEVVESNSPPEGDHIQNFFSAIRGDSLLNSDVAEAQTSAMLCHLGNISWRTGQTIEFDPKERKIIGNPEATALWKREYRQGWEPRV